MPTVKYILFNDAAEYYFVCGNCYGEFVDMQWAGSTRGTANWRELAYLELDHAIGNGQPCEFCGPQGNGGWMIDGKFPAAERRDARKDH